MLENACQARRMVFSTPAAAWIAALVCAPFAGAADPLAALNDEFDDAATLASWRLHHVEEGWPSQLRALDVDTTAPGHLYIEPEVSGWYGDLRGNFLYKEVTGDFIVTVRLTVTGLEGDVPQASFSLAGIMVRAPRPAGPWVPGRENWLFINQGANDRAPRTETKTTRDSSSILNLIASRTGPVELRIERAGARFTLSRKFDDGDWEEMAVFDRPDLPSTLQVGIDSYTDWDSVAPFASDPLGFNSTVIPSPPGGRDLVTRVDFIRFSTPCPGGNCEETAFLRGDANADGAVDLSDAVRALLHLFAGASLACEKSADADDSGALDVADPIHALAALFRDGAPPPAPAGECGPDPTADALDCAAHAPCG